VKILQAFGIWKTKGSSRNYKIYGIAVQLFFINLPLFGLLNVANIDELAGVLLLLPTLIAIAIKSILLTTCINEFAAVLKSLEAFMKTVKLSLELVRGN